MAFGREEKNLNQRVDGQRETHGYTELCFTEKSSFVLLLALYLKGDELTMNKLLSL